MSYKFMYVLVLSNVRARVPPVLIIAVVTKLIELSVEKGTT